MVKSSPSNPSIWDPTCLLAKKPEHKSRSNIITNSIMTKTWFIYVKIKKKKLIGSLSKVERSPSCGTGSSQLVEGLNTTKG